MVCLRAFLTRCLAPGLFGWYLLFVVGRLFGSFINSVGQMFHVAVYVIVLDGWLLC